MRLIPGDEQELVEILQATRESFDLLGGGTRWPGSGRGLPGLSMEQNTGIVHYEPGALTLVARSGTPLKQIEDVLDQSGQCLPFEPPRYNLLTGADGRSTIGGVVATNASGPRRVQWGSCRDYLLGTRFVTGSGRVLNSGGRVMKNVTGYDVSRLMCGSHGQFGVLTEVALKVLPRARATATLRLADLDLPGAIEAMTLVMGTPCEVSGAAYRPGTNDTASSTLVRLEGMEQSVICRSEQLSRMLEDFGEVEVVDDTARSRLYWSDIRDVRHLGGRPGNVWRICIKAGNCPGLIAALGSRFEFDYLVDWAGSLVWILTRHEGDIREDMTGMGGDANLVKAAGDGMESVPRFHCQSPGVSRIMSALKNRFDPRGILNPGIDMTGCGQVVAI